MELDFSELQENRTAQQAGARFEELVAEYFRKIKELPSNSIVDTTVTHSGEGADGGQDLIVRLKFNDNMTTFERFWVVQCKFFSKNVTAKDISSINIPSLIHSYKADGYLLICKEGVGKSITELFNNLENSCRFCYKYEFWRGSQFKDKLLSENMTSILQQYFPKYYNSIYIKSQNLDSIYSL